MCFLSAFHVSKSFGGICSFAGHHSTEFATQRGSRVGGCGALKKARDPVGIASRLIEARGGLEPVKRIVGREIVPFNRLRVAIGNFDREPAPDGKTCRLDGGEWA